MSTGESPGATRSRGAVALITGARPGPVPSAFVDGHRLRHRVLAQLLGVRLVKTQLTDKSDAERGRRVAALSANAERAITKTASGISAFPSFAESRLQYVSSEATRLMCAGTYVDPTYRKHVIKELIGEPNRNVAQAIGYDNVTVLGHALAARRLRRFHLAARFVGLFALFSIFPSDLGMWLLLSLWLLWILGTIFRVALLNALTSRLKEPFNGSFPPSISLPPSLEEKIREGQQPRPVITYGSYNPFIGSGRAGRSWSITQLLSGFADSHSPGEAAVSGRSTGRGSIIPFTSSEITDFVAARMDSELNESYYGEFAEPASVERQRYARASNEFPHEYLCVRIGTADRELIVSAFIGFDLRGDALHTEFHTYVLLPVNDAFRVVDRLPARLGARLIWRISWHVVADVPRNLNKRFRRLFGNVPSLWAPGPRRRRTEETAYNDPGRLARYAVPVDRGPVVSIRELAAGADYSSLFQEADAEKFRELVERKVLRLIRDFLEAHNVDPAEHDEFQAGILYQGIVRNGDDGPFHSSVPAAAPQSRASRATSTTSR